MNMLLERLKNQLVVSCQALEEEPLHSPMVMGKMALAAEMGGAGGIRANSPKDIIEIKKNVALPVIGIWKQVYPDSEVFITPGWKEIREIIATGAEIVATDATFRSRPNNEQLEEIVATARKEAPETLLMADISSLEEAVKAEQLGFDMVSTTLVGYTKETEGQAIMDDNFRLLQELVNRVALPVVAEGKIATPELAREALDHGAQFVVVGGAITRPQLITKSFIEQIKK